MENQENKSSNWSYDKSPEKSSNMTASWQDTMQSPVHGKTYRTTGFRVPEMGSFNSSSLNTIQSPVHGKTYRATGWRVPDMESPESTSGYSTKK